tara:strand:+ start:29 stop:169 length:141 start_codon:yes stop_codon:yes gene_type:complete
VELSSVTSHTMLGFSTFFKSLGEQALRKIKIKNTEEGFDIFINVNI